VQLKTCRLVMCLCAASLTSSAWGGLIEVVGQAEAIGQDERVDNSVANEGALAGPLSGDVLGDRSTAHDAAGAHPIDDPPQDSQSGERGTEDWADLGKAPLGALAVVECSAPLCYTTSARHVSLSAGSGINSSFLRSPLTDSWTLQFAGTNRAIGEFLPVMAESIEILTIPPHESWSRRRWKPAQ
jgi:hypothetical protein